MRFYDRMIRVRVGDYIDITSRGRDTDMQVSVQEKQHVVQVMEPGQVVVTNLSEDTRRAASRRLGRVTVDVAWAGTPKTTLVDSTAYFVHHERQGADITTTFHTMPMGVAKLSSEVVQRNWQPGTPCATVIKDVCAQLGIDVKDDVPSYVEGSIGPKGLSWSGDARRLLQTLGEEHGFSWNVTAGVLTALDDNKAFRTGITVLNRETGLIKAQVEVPQPFNYVAAVSVQALFVPGVVPGSRVRIESPSSGVVGDYTVHEVGYNMSSHDQQWEMDMRSELYAG